MSESLAHEEIPNSEEEKQNTFLQLVELLN